MEQWIGPGNITVVGILLIAIASGAKGIWQFSYQTKKETDRLEKIITDQRADFDIRLKESREDGQEWKELALSATDIGKRVAQVAEKSVGRR
jgi:hypothetical protein